MLDLPHRLAGRKPDLTTDIVVAVAAIGLAVVGRAIVDLFTPGVVAYAFVYPAVIFASLIAGARSGFIAAACCQVLIWYFVIPPRRSFEITTPDAIGLLVATASLALVVWAVASFRATSMRLQEEKERHVELLSVALREVDHRTRNNFQIAASLLLSRAAGAGEADPRLRDELHQAAGRLQSLAAAYSNLALSSADLSTILVHEHLREICDRVREGMLPAGVSLSFDAEPVQLPAQSAVAVALIVNECLTNAAKHAFPDGLGAVAVWLRPDGDHMIVTIEDDGIGRDRGKDTGTGSKLIDMMARSLKAEFHTSSGATTDRGTRCELRVPLTQK